MLIHNVGFDHRHDPDFFIDRPNGSGDALMLFLKTDAIFTLDGLDITVPARSFFLYPVGMPQRYRAVPQQTYANDWMHFLFEGEEEAHFRSLGIPYAEPVPLEHPEFFTYCIKAIADENSAKRLHSADSVQHFFWLICNKVSEQLIENDERKCSSSYEMLLTVRNEVYAHPDWEWSVDWASHQTRMSRSAFLHHYKEQFGVTFIQELVSSRIAYAQMLLATTDIPVHSIGTQCGYRNYEHFARQFRSRCGMSPGEYRKKNQS